MNAAHGLDDAAAGLEELAGLINFRVGAWQDFGYAEPPAPDSATIPPLGQRSAKAIEAGHEAVKDIDRLIARLHQVRALLVSELRQDQDVRAARIDKMLGGETSGQDDAGRAITADLDEQCGEVDEEDPAEEGMHQNRMACGDTLWDYEEYAEGAAMHCPRHGATSAITEEQWLAEHPAEPIGFLAGEEADDEPGGGAQ